MRFLTQGLSSLVVHRDMRHDSAQPTTPPSAKPTTVLYLHPIEVRYLDYGDYMSSVHGVVWSTDGETYMPGIERVEFATKWVDCVAAIKPGCGVELRRGKPFKVSHDMNPHGHI